MCKIQCSLSLCAFFPHVPQSAGGVSGPVHPATGHVRLRRTLTDLENILGTLENNRRSYEDAVFGLDNPTAVVLDDGERGFKTSRLSRTLDESALWTKLRATRGQKRGGRPCYWNVVSCYGK